MRKVDFPWEKGYVGKEKNGMTPMSFSSWIESEFAVQAFEEKGITKREQEILLWLLRGKTTVEIALILGISRRTVSKHFESLFPKLGATSKVLALSRVFDMYQEYQKELNYLQPVG